MSIRLGVAVVSQATGPSIIKATVNDVDDVAAARVALIARHQPSSPYRCCASNRCACRRGCVPHTHTHTCEGKPARIRGSLAVRRCRGVGELLYLNGENLTSLPLYLYG